MFLRFYTYKKGGWKSFNANYSDPTHESNDYYKLGINSTESFKVLPFKTNFKPNDDCILIGKKVEQKLRKNNIEVKNEKIIIKFTIDSGLGN